jgi:predicted nucleic-acid-binding Zn-ribbon protein
MRIINFFKRLLGYSSCPKCGSSNLDGDNLAAWCEDCDWSNFGEY